MNDEIREILEYLKKKENTRRIKCITIEESKQLLDYITNLQKENEELKKNQRYYKNGVFSLEYDKETLSDMVDDYKSRIEKAVENLKLKQIKYVNESDYVIDDGDLQEEINILQNGSDEE